jgi:hypothetical protein
MVAASTPAGCVIGIDAGAGCVIGGIPAGLSLVGFGGG